MAIAPTLQKYLADENLRQAIVRGLKRREPSIDFLRASVANLAGKDDLTLLQFAAREGRILVSRDIRTLPRHFDAFIRHQVSPGVFLIPQNLALAGVIEELLIVWTASEAVEWQNRICYLPL